MFKSYYVTRTFELMKTDIYYKVKMHCIETRSHEKPRAASLGTYFN